MVAGTVPVQATATDDVGVVGVQFKLDGVALGAEVLVPPYVRSWDTTTVADGAHTLTAEARDAANNLGTSSVVVTVRNTPVTSVSYYVELNGINDYLSRAGCRQPEFRQRRGRHAADHRNLVPARHHGPQAEPGQQMVGGRGPGVPPLYRAGARSGWTCATGARRRRCRPLRTISTGLAGGWHHLAVTYDGRGGVTAANGITFYIDGVVVPVTRYNNAAYVAMEHWTAPLQVGRETDQLPAVRRRAR